jgi:TolC family type I secretion outer membrane protein
MAQLITLEEVYAKALQVNEQVTIAREGIDIARFEKDRALSGMLPNFEATASYTRRPEAILSGGNAIRAEEEKDFELHITQPLYSGGRAMATYKSAKEGVRASMEDLRVAQEELLFNAATAYYNVLKAQKSLSLSRVEVARLEKHQKDSESRFKVGEVTKTIVLRSQAELSRAKADLVRAEADLKTARDQLILLAKLPDDFEVSDPPAAFLPPGDEPTLIQLAHQRRPDLASTSIREVIALNGIRFARGGFLPTLSLEGTYIRQDQDPENPFFFVRRDKQATVTLTLPLFEGGLRLAELREARSKARQAELERFLLEDRIGVEVKTALRDLVTVNSILQNFKDQVAFAQENFTLVEKQFAFGLATNIDVLDANSLLHQAQLQLSNTEYDRELAVLKLQKTVGTFLDRISSTQSIHP